MIVLIISYQTFFLHFKVPGQTISNWELMEKIKGMCAPYQFALLKVSKSTLEFVR